MTQHVQQPRLCPDCETSAQAFADTGQPDSAVYQICEHNRVIGVASKIAQRIVTWHLEGPIDPDKFDVYAVSVLAVMMSKGMRVQEVTRQ